jgi:hypothetical protein
MLSYEVTIQLDDLSLANALEDYMRTHVPAVLATGCFIDAHFERRRAISIATSPSMRRVCARISSSTFRAVCASRAASGLRSFELRE